MALSSLVTKKNAILLSSTTAVYSMYSAQVMLRVAVIDSDGTGARSDAGDVKCKVVAMDSHGNWLDVSRGDRNMPGICNGTIQLQT